jgi:hypothetical protein
LTIEVEIDEQQDAPEEEQLEEPEELMPSKELTSVAAIEEDN